MDIIVNEEELFHKLDVAPSHPRYQLLIACYDTEGEMSFDIDTDNDHDVAIRLLFQFDIDTEGSIHIYTNGLDDSLRNELLAYFDECNVQYKTE